MSDFAELDRLYDDHFGIINPEPEHPAERIADLNNSDDDVDETNAQPSTESRIQNFLCDVRTLLNNTCRNTTESENESSTEGEQNEDVETVKAFFEKGCGCKKYCLSQFTEKDIFEHILSLRDMLKDEKEMYIMGKLNRHPPLKSGKRRRQQFQYTHNGLVICMTAFGYIHDVKQASLKNIVKHYDENGCVPRVHGNTGKKNPKAVTYQDAERVVHFLQNMGDECGLPQSAAPRGTDDLPPIYLPSSFTQVELHKKYGNICANNEVRALSRASFLSIWKSCCPNIRISKPRDDVCQKCETLRKRILDARTDDEKLNASTEFTDHMTAVQMERDAYRQWVQDAKKELSEIQLPIVNNAPASTPLTKVHYSFDFSQNVSIPHHSRQMGPLYFCTPKKVQIFGVRDDGNSTQYNFLIDEGETIGADGTLTHGPNAVLSMVDHALTNYTYGEKECGIHADNCSGQNKNRYTMAYFAWRVMLGLHRQIILHMQIPGHTRCLIDGGFAHIKRLYRRIDCDSMGQLADIVDKSATSNIAVEYKGPENAPTWEWRYWKAFLAQYFKPFNGIRKFQQFRFSTENPGVVFAKKNDADVETAVNILRNPDFRFSDSARPPVIAPGGLSRKRLEYLHRFIKPLVRPAFWAELCPPLPEQ